MSTTRLGLLRVATVGGALGATGLHAWMTLGQPSGSLLATALVAIGSLAGAGSLVVGRVRIGAAGLAVAAAGLLLGPLGVATTADRAASLAIAGLLLVVFEAGEACHRLSTMRPEPTQEVAKGTSRALLVRILLVAGLVTAVAFLPVYLASSVAPPLAAMSLEIRSPVAVAAVATVLVGSLLALGALRWGTSSAGRDT